MRVVFTPSARARYLAVLDSLRRHNRTAAEKFRGKSERALRRLEQFPESGSILEEFPDLPYREVLVSPYRFFYRVEAETVWIVAVWHAAQLPDEPTA